MILPGPGDKCHKYAKKHLAGETPLLLHHEGSLGQAQMLPHRASCGEESCHPGLCLGHHYEIHWEPRDLAAEPWPAQCCLRVLPGPTTGWAWPAACSPAAVVPIPCPGQKHSRYRNNGSAMGQWAPEPMGWDGMGRDKMGWPDPMLAPCLVPLTAESDGKPEAAALRGCYNIVLCSCNLDREENKMGRLKWKLLLLIMLMKPVYQAAQRKWNI